MEDNKNENSERKVLSIVAHASIFIGSTLLAIAIPIIILASSADLVVKENAREALNFYINAYIFALLCIPLTFVLIGIPLLVLLFISTLVMPIIAIVKVLENSDRSYRYPIIAHIL